MKETTITQPQAYRAMAGKWYLKGYANYGLMVFAVGFSFVESPSWVPWVIVAALALINAKNYMRYGDDLVFVANQMESGNVKVISK